MAEMDIASGGAERPIILAVVGKVGVGKSTLINNFLGLEGTRAASVRKVVTGSVTTEVTQYDGEVNGIAVKMFDTPGFEGAVERESLTMLSQSAAGRADFLLYCISLSGTRFDERNVDVIKKLNKTFSKRIWERTILVLTHGDVVMHDEISDEDSLVPLVSEYCQEFQAALKKAGVSAVTVSVAYEESPSVQSGTIMKAVAIGKKLQRPLQWKENLFQQIVTNCDIYALTAPETLKLQSTRSNINYIAMSVGGVAGGLAGWFVGDRDGAVFGTILGVFGGTLFGKFTRHKFVSFLLQILLISASISIFALYHHQVGVPSESTPVESNHSEDNEKLL